MARTLAQAGLEPEPAPEGKIIDRIVVLRHPIIEASDPWPAWLNIFHLVTRERTVRRELLFGEGQPYREELVRESERNLRSLTLVFSVVRLVAARSADPKAVTVVAVTKDLWSLRLNSQFNFGGGVFNYLSLMPTEQNFLGLAQQLSLYTYIDRDTASVGQTYLIPRFFGSRLTAAESVNFRLNHHSGEMEGGFGYAALVLPLVSLSDEWGFSLGGSLDTGLSRHYQGRQLLEQCYQIEAETACLPWKWGYSRVESWLQAVRSFGSRQKLNLVFGYGVRWYEYWLPEEAAAQPAEARRRFGQEVLPQQERASELSVRLSYFLADYLRLYNIQAFGLSEDFRQGPQAALEVAFSHPALGPGLELRALRLRAEMGWLWWFHENILHLLATAEARWLPDHRQADALAAGTRWVDRWLELELENVSPVLAGMGRLYFRTKYVLTQYDTQGRRLSLGGDTTLRGFVSGYQSGERLLNFNVEFRTQPLVIWTLHWGVVLFYDGGDAYGYHAQDDFSYHQSLGLGVRGLFPQFDIEVFRLDIGVPLGQDFSTHLIDWVTVSFRQAF